MPDDQPHVPAAAPRILYVVGFDATEAAVTWQVAEVSRARQQPIILFATVPRRLLWGDDAGRRRESKRRLGQVMRRLQQMHARVAGIKVATGPLPAAALRSAQELDASLIMIGAGDAALADPRALAPGVLQLARQAPVDVWICRPRAEPVIDHVLCAVDTSAAAAAALAASVALCRRFGARLRVLSVMLEPSPHLPKGTAAAGAFPGGSGDPDLEVDRARAAQRGFLASQDLGGVALSRCPVWAQEPADEIVFEAERYWDGVLVIGAGPTLDATAARVLRLCPSSLLIVRRAPAAAAPRVAEPSVAAAPECLS